MHSICQTSKYTLWLNTQNFIFRKIKTIINSIIWNVRNRRFKSIWKALHLPKKCNLFLCYFHQFHIIQYQYHSDFLFLINTDKKIAKRLHITENFYISAILHGSLLPPPRGLIMSVFFKKNTHHLLEIPRRPTASSSARRAPAYQPSQFTRPVPNQAAPAASALIQGFGA